MNTTFIIILVAIIAYFAQRAFFSKRGKPKPALPDISGWIEVLGPGHEVLMVGRKIADTPRLGSGAMAVWGAIVVDQVDAALIEHIARITTPIYLDPNHIFAKILVVGYEDETMVIGKLNDAAMIEKLQAAIDTHAATVDLRLRVATESVGLIDGPGDRTKFDAVWNEYVR
jgi:hypothetical protein